LLFNPKSKIQNLKSKMPGHLSLSTYTAEGCKFWPRKLVIPVEKLVVSVEKLVIPVEKFPVSDTFACKPALPQRPQRGGRNSPLLSVFSVLSVAGPSTETCIFPHFCQTFKDLHERWKKRTSPDKSRIWNLESRISGYNSPLNTGKRPSGGT